MDSWKFPDLFKNDEIEVLSGTDAALQDLTLFINSELNEFRFDPACGSAVPMLIYHPKSPLTDDLMRDAIYETQYFCPNIRFNRDQISIKKTKPGEVLITIPIFIDNNITANEAKLYMEAKR